MRARELGWVTSLSRERFIDPHFFRSESVSQLSIPARLALIGLIVCADDHGRGRGSPRAVQLEVFPAGDVTVEQVDAWLREVERLGIARFYVVDGTTYYDLPHWATYQHLKSLSCSKLPQPPSTPADPARSGQIRPGLETGRGGEGSDGMDTPPTPRKPRGAARARSAPRQDEAAATALDVHWRQVIADLPKHKPNIKDPAGYVATI